MRTNRILSAALVACGAIGLSTPAFATNGYQLIGIGAYQKGMGGAVTANPQSAMTAITNPAGMAAIGDRADFSAEAFMPDRTVDFTDQNLQGEKQDSEVSMYAVPSLGWAAPVSDGSDFYFGGGMYGTSGLGVDYAPTNFTGTGVSFDGYSNIQFWQMAPTLAWKQSNQLKLGAALNIDYQAVSFTERIVQPDGGLPAGAAGYSNDTIFNLGRTAQGIGFGVSLGALYDINSMVSVGVTYKSKQSFSAMEYQLRGDGLGGLRDDIQNFPNGGGGTVSANTGTYKMDLDYPQQAALGIKVQPMPKLRISADIKWINWSDTMDKLAIKGNFDVNGPGPSKAALNPGWDDQTVYALGVNYEATPDLQLRAGYNYAESPIGKEDVFANIILPAVVQSHFTLGGTYALNNHWDVTFAYMKAFKNDVKGKGDIPTSFQGSFGQDSNTKISLSEDSYTLNLGYRF